MSLFVQPAARMAGFLDQKSVPPVKRYAAGVLGQCDLQSGSCSGVRARVITAGADGVSATGGDGGAPSSERVATAVERGGAAAGAPAAALASAAE
jgi:hypothetical protein